MKPFCLEIELESPVITMGFLTLDAVLAAARFYQTEDVAQALTNLPLDKGHGIWKASAISFDPSLSIAEVDYTMSLRSPGDLHIDAYAPKRDRYTPVDQARGAYLRRLETYKGYQARRAYFFGVGDAEACRDLLQDYLPGLGKKSRSGAGEFGEIRVHDIQTDFSWKNAQGEPMRPLPVAIWPSVGGEPNPPEDFVAARAPYWDKKHFERCVVPGTRVFDPQHIVTTEDW